MTVTCTIHTNTELHQITNTECGGATAVMCIAWSKMILTLVTIKLMMSAFVEIPGAKNRPCHWNHEEAWSIVERVWVNDFCFSCAPFRSLLPLNSWAVVRTAIGQKRRYMKLQIQKRNIEKIVEQISGKTCLTAAEQKLP